MENDKSFENFTDFIGFFAVLTVLVPPRRKRARLWLWIVQSLRCVVNPPQPPIWTCMKSILNLILLTLASSCFLAMLTSKRQFLIED